MKGDVIITNLNPSRNLKEANGDIFECIKFNNPPLNNKIAISGIKNEYKDNQKIMKSIFIPSEIEGLKVMGILHSAFANITSLKQVIIPNSVTNINSAAFSGCSSLIDIKLPADLWHIGDSAFKRCESLRELPNISKNITNIPDSCFAECCSLSYANIPVHIKIIDAFAFKDCKDLRVVILNDNIEFINPTAFAGVNPDLCVFKCNPGSYAEDWATRHHFKTQPIRSELERKLKEISAQIAAHLINT